ncbi:MULTISPECIES: carbohydrate ABC transporter permease [unclassified Micromonospora]|uniref:carbohydrate ABC transporter permease n=1 Tax=unclassified Micromonospora TaxID=2617518 RepID=UPI0022C1B095|nr:sugar ABC transporter permease [Micromonospora sp. AKA38]GHJ15923.1 cytochrome c biogenesis protein [Micromonospora sp. AKA38]
MTAPVTVKRTPQRGGVPLPVSDRRRGPGRRQRVAYLFIAPFFVVFVAFQLAAMVVSLGMSLTDWKGAIGGQFVGLGNYAALFGDPAFLKALWHTLVIWVLTVPVLTFGGLFLAHLLNGAMVKAKPLLRVLLFLPVLPSLVVVGVVFLLLLDPVFGLPNIILARLGLPIVDLRNDPSTALPVLSLVVIWRWLGYNVTIHLAGLQALPRDVFESARVDGANAWQTFWRVLVPMSKPTLVFVTIMSTIGIFNLFDEPYVLFGSEAGPAQAGLTLGVYMYKQGFEFFNLGYASAISYSIAALVFVASLIQLKASRDD